MRGRRTTTCMSEFQGRSDGVPLLPPSREGQLDVSVVSVEGSSVARSDSSSTRGHASSAGTTAAVMMAQSV